MRPRKVWPDIPPLHLRRFNPDDWPAHDDPGAFDCWHLARLAFAQVHGWPGGLLEELLERGSEHLRHFNELDQPAPEDV